MIEVYITLPQRQTHFIVESGEFLPKALKFDSAGDLYVISSGAERKLRKYNGINGSLISTIITGTNVQIGNPIDFILHDNETKIIVLNSFNRGTLFDITNGNFLGYYLNPTGDTTNMLDPRAIQMGPDGKYWVSNRGFNCISRYEPLTGAKIDNLACGHPLNNGPGEFAFDENHLFVTNGNANNVIQIDLNNVSQKSVFVQSSSQGLSQAQYMIKTFINDAPIADAGADFTIPGGELFGIDGSASYDPDGDDITVEWTFIGENVPTSSTAPANYQPNNASGGSGAIAGDLCLFFIAPYLPTQLTFELKVTDSSGVFSTDLVVVTVSPSFDYDADEMPDLWENQTNGVSAGVYDGHLDSDGDGVSNLNEFLAGTDPANSSSVLKILSLTKINNGFEVKISSIVGRHYALETSTNLQSWGLVPGFDDVVAVGSETTFTDTFSPNSPRRFNRIKVLKKGF